MSPRFRPGRLSGPCLWFPLSQPELTQSYERENLFPGFLSKELHILILLWAMQIH